ncbi:MAG: LEA type 2 family protein [Gammaproteobacteria bacterium]|nr:LEA type 2 family protein [Pseudomonadales bacterium]MCP5347730.1 LEA type 2 family protein [Pseudomonadales bacterium]
MPGFVKTRIAYYFVIMLLLASCSGLGINERPVVTLTNLRLLESEGLSMRFAIDLRITNPGPISIPVDGLSWELQLEGSRILTGVSNNVPLLEAYTEVPLTVEASTNLTGMVELFTRLMSRRNDQFDYELSTRLGLAGFRLPITYTDSGSVTLTRLQQSLSQ